MKDTKTDNTNKNDLPRSCAFLLTFNNPKEHGYNTEKPEDMKEAYFEKAKEKWASVLYMCCTKEIGNETKTEHDHLYIRFQFQVWRKSIQKVFPNCHIDVCKGSPEENRDYVFKAEAYFERHPENKDKEDTRVDGYQFEWGEIPKFRKNQGKRNDLVLLRDLLLQGLSNAQIYAINADFMRYAGGLDRMRLDLISEKYSKEWRNLNVIYQCGTTGTGKTRGVMEKYGYEKVYRATDYTHPFDSYNLEDIIVFEEFRSNLKISDMLNYLDGYPVVLPSRYANRQACFHTIYINSNWRLDEQYEDIQEKYPETWQAFLRRVNEVHVFEDGKVYVYKQYRKADGTYDFVKEDGVFLFDPLNPLEAEGAPVEEVSTPETFDELPEVKEANLLDWLKP